MELVYLWVEKYKNIENQGFNFSPRFTCEYEDGELTIDKKEHVSIFPDNINITAIVGENGSGKSNIFEALLSNFMENGIPIDEPFRVISIFYNKQDEKLYYKDLNRCVTRFSNFNKDIKLLREHEICSIKDTGIFTFHYNYGLDWIYNNENNLDFNRLYHKTDDYKTPILLQPNKANNQIHISNIDYLATREILNFTIHKNVSFDFINKFFTPTKCKLKFKLTNISKRDDNHIYKSVSNYYENFSHTDIEKLIYLSRAYIIRKTFSKGDNDSYSIIKDQQFQKDFQRESLHEKNLDTFITYISNKNFKDLYYDNINYKTDKIKQTFLFIEYLQTLDKFDWSLLREQMLPIQKHKDLLLNLAPWIEIEFFNDSDISFYSLSYGQKFMIKFVYSLLSQLYNLTSHSEYKEIILLLDEVELGLHPNWQREYLSILIKVLNTKIEGFDFKYNIICASHSPFIISDLPKENVIFLDKFDDETKKKYPKLKIYGLEKGNCINASKHIELNPFGANIHTLLSHGFFMRDGLMGEFAKEKIQSVIDFLNDTGDDNLNQQEAWSIIKIIGEPFLKHKLEEKFHEKFSTDEEKRTAKIKQLEEELERLKNVKSKD